MKFSNVACVLEKYWYVLEISLNCSWVFIAKIAGHPGKNHKNLIISRTKRAFVIKGKNIFLNFLKDYHLEKQKFDKNSGHKL